MTQEDTATSQPARSGTRPDDDYQPDPQRWKALGVCLVAGFMSLLDVSIVNVALPSIRDGLHASASDLQWVVSGYALAFGLVLVPAGRLGDARGRRAVFIVGVALFTLASAACGLAVGPVMLAIARLAQGVGGGLINPQTSGFIQELFRGAERGKAFGILGATIGLSTAVGPLAGGGLIAAFGTADGWRAVFFVNVPVGIVAVLMARRLLPRGGDPSRHQSLDPVGVVLLGLGVLALLLPLVEEQTWKGSAKWLLVPVAVVLLAAFALWERAYKRRGQTPMVDVTLFTERSYTAGSGIALVYFAGFTAIFFVLALFLQSGRAYSAWESGLAVTPFALGSAVAAALAGRVVTRLGRPLVAGGLVMVAVGLVLTDVAIALVDGRSVGFWTALPLLVAGIGSGAVISPNITLTLSEVPVRMAGSAGGVLQTAQRVGSAVGIAAVGSVFFAHLSATRGDWGSATGVALRLCTAGVLLATVLAVVDVVGQRRQDHRAAQAAGQSSPSGS
ncbi:MAG TPA: MFS transporter [Motilibacteraceae bacterium]|nr:MFS transporter [Motilibacteraceae bacterium]